MERGLFWLSLLIVIFLLTWLGWNEYQKVEAYRMWAENFDQAKYDIYAVLGHKNQTITWGKPTRKGIIEIQTFSLTDVQEIKLLVNNQPVDLNSLPAKGEASLEFSFKNQPNSVKIPFTEIDLAAKWETYLKKIGNF